MTRRTLRFIALAATLSLFVICFAPRAARADDQTSLVKGVDSIGLVVSDVDRAVAFYARVLDFEKVSDVEVVGSDIESLYGIPQARARIVRMSLGAEAITLTEFLEPKGRLIPADSRSNDRWFQHFAIVTNDMDAAYRRLLQNDVEPDSASPQTLPDWNRNAAGIRAFYFKDPDGHPLEMIQFPPGKGLAKWQEPNTNVFLGIDHTAIVVSDTDASLLFYRDLLGLRIVGRSENYGPEQERLNNVSSARLRITSLRAASGPGIELLEYLTPRDGRSLPPESQPMDLVSTRTRLIVTEPAAFDRISRSPAVHAITASAVQFSKPGDVAVRDRDGHILHLMAVHHGQSD